jgi:predicted GNAT family acetyltransferase
MNDAAIEVRDRPAEDRFEAEMDGATAILTYSMDNDMLVLTHTVVPGELEGRGIGSALVRAALAAARDRGLKVVPICSFVADYMRRHPETRDLLADASRS